MSEHVNLDELDTVRGGDAGFELKIKAPNGKELPGHIRIRGYDSTTYQQKVDEQQRTMQNRVAMKKIPTPEDLNGESVELAAVLVMGWSIPFTLEGQPLEYSQASALKLLQRFPWIREQVERAASVRANFLPGSAQS